MITHEENIEVEHNCPKGNKELTFCYVVFSPATYVCNECGYEECDPND